MCEKQRQVVGIHLDRQEKALLVMKGRIFAKVGALASLFTG
jgi:hypothetical protein